MRKKLPYQSQSKKMMNDLAKYQADQKRVGRWIGFLVVLTILTFIANVALGG